jgi:hypothetical protein
MIDRDTIQKAIYALDLAQSLLEKSGHHQQIFDAYTNLRQAFSPDLSVEANRVAYEVAMHYANKTKEKLG